MSADRLVAFLQALIRTRSMPGEEAELTDRVVQEWHDLQFDEVRTDAAGNALAFVRGREPGPAWLLLTHLDHVSEGDASLWTHPPFEGVLEGDTVHGRGAVDIKGPLAAQTYALAALLARGERPRRDVWIAAVTQEEVGGEGAAHLVAHPPGEIGAVIVAEPSSNRLMLGHRGVAHVHVQLRGRAHHASLALHDQNPFFALGELLRRVQALTFEPHPVVGASSLTVTQVTHDSGSENLTPNTVTAVLDWRFSEEDAENRATLARLLRDLPTDAQLAPLWTAHNTPGFSTAPEHPLARLVAPYAAASQGDVGATPGVWKFATDGRYTHAAGWPTVGWGPGDEGLAHTTQERVSVPEMQAYATALADLLSRETF
ncbi:M20 family metallopeptidase [Deinococcus maricopensis]|uniref:Peptidase M20 n=1 Tax=Deinococcus maricopensis (strain DSM 21211 / LMG 22137 / NRRL B-23946 / LB-34) TaxID=709986 RepID=E8U5N4_DEIML|nr:M20/M25/M40 family metallo-hydrolase [Deinococcus maricopensis]ADV66373.1 peptidase M20 [Deinococcus maricopensis DSM 21211]